MPILPESLAHPPRKQKTMSVIMFREDETQIKIRTASEMEGSRGSQPPLHREQDQSLDVGLKAQYVCKKKVVVL